MDGRSAAKYRVYIADHYHGPYELTSETGTEYSKFNMANYWDYYYGSAAFPPQDEAHGRFPSRVRPIPESVPRTT